MGAIPTYTEDSQKEKFEKGITNAWPSIYRFINGLFYFIMRTTKNTIIGIIQQVFH